MKVNLEVGEQVEYRRGVSEWIACVVTDIETVDADCVLVTILPTHDAQEKMTLRIISLGRALGKNLS
jgi:hypothetical protein